MMVMTPAAVTHILYDDDCVVSRYALKQVFRVVAFVRWALTQHGECTSWIVWIRLSNQSLELLDEIAVTDVLSTAAEALVGKSRITESAMTILCIHELVMIESNLSRLAATLTVDFTSHVVSGANECDAHKVVLTELLAAKHIPSIHCAVSDE